MKKKARRRRKTSKSRRSTSEIDPAFAPVVAAFANDRQVEQKRMFSSQNVLTVNGKIFAMLARGRFVAKLPRESVDALVREGRGEYFDPGHGRLMKEWVSVDSPPESWIDLAKEAYRFVKDANRP